MKLPRLAVEYSSFTWMVFVFLTIVGIRALVVMPRTENPEVSVPGSSIVVTMPGASPVDMESLQSPWNLISTPMPMRNTKRWFGR